MKQIHLVKQLNGTFIPTYDSDKEYVTAKESIDFIVKGRKYELIEMESVGAYIVDETGKEEYYHNTSLVYERNRPFK